MYTGPIVFTQLMAHLPRHSFRRLVKRYEGERRARTFTCWHQFLCMAFAQLTYRESLRDIEVCLRAVPEKLYHMGLSGGVARNTLAVANEKRDWRIYAAFAQPLIATARRLYVDEPLGVELDRTVYALDATTIDLCMSLFPWAQFRSTKSGVKLHTLLDLAGNIPTYVWITDAKMNDVRILDVLLPEPGSVYVMDRGYIDFTRLHRLTEARATFVVRAKSNLVCRRQYSRPVDRTTGLICDQTIVLSREDSAEAYPAKLRRVRFKDPETAKEVVLLTNDFTLPALTVAQLYRARWQIELFFRWIKQHLRIKRFYGTSPNAVRTQIWIAISTYVLVAIVRKRLNLDRDLYTLLQILSICPFEQVPLAQVLAAPAYTPTDHDIHNQLSLFKL